MPRFHAAGAKRTTEENGVGRALASGPSSGSAPGGGFPEHRQGRIVILLLLALSLALAVLHYSFLAVPADFWAIWSYGLFLLSHPAAGLYDAAGLDTFQVGLGMDTTLPFPFPYPPTFMLLLWPLGLLTVQQACVAWLGLTCAGFVWAAAGPRPAVLTVLALLVAPATTMGVVAGQGGFLFGALLIGGMRLIEARPWLGGLLLGVLTCKPQLGLLVPVALVAAGAWRGIAATTCVAVALALLATAVFGATIWLDWLASLSGYSAWFAVQATLLPLKPTLTANLVLLGFPEAAGPVQVLAGAAMAVLVWFAFRRGVSRAALGVLVAATALANPHAFFYDLPMLTPAVLFLLAARLRMGQPVRWWEGALLVPVLCLPAAMVWTRAFGMAVPISLPILLAFAAWAAWQVRLGATAPG